MAWDTFSVRPIFMDVLWLPHNGLNLLQYDLSDPTLPLLNTITQEGTPQVAGQMNNMFFSGNTLSMGGTLQFYDMEDPWDWSMYIVKRHLTMTPAQQETAYLANPAQYYESLLYEINVKLELTGNTGVIDVRAVMHGTNVERDPVTQVIINTYHAPILEHRGSQTITLTNRDLARIARIRRRWTARRFRGHTE